MTLIIKTTFKSLRLRTKLSQAELAEALGLTVDVVRNIEDGKLPVLPLYLHALIGLQFERAQTDTRCITAKMLSAAQAILEQAGYEVVARTGGTNQLTDQNGVPKHIRSPTK